MALKRRAQRRRAPARRAQRRGRTSCRVRARCSRPSTLRPAPSVHAAAAPRRCPVAVLRRVAARRALDGGCDASPTISSAVGRRGELDATAAGVRARSRPTSRDGGGDAHLVLALEAEHRAMSRRALPGRVRRPLVAQVDDDGDAASAPRATAGATSDGRVVAPHGGVAQQSTAAIRRDAARPGPGSPSSAHCGRPSRVHDQQRVRGSRGSERLAHCARLLCPTMPGCETSRGCSPCRRRPRPRDVADARERHPAVAEVDRARPRRRRPRVAAQPACAPREHVHRRSARSSRERRAPPRRRPRRPAGPCPRPSATRARSAAALVHATPRRRRTPPRPSSAGVTPPTRSGRLAGGDAAPAPERGDEHACPGRAGSRRRRGRQAADRRPGRCPSVPAVDYAVAQARGSTSRMPGTAVHARSSRRRAVVVRRSAPQQHRPLPACLHEVGGQLGRRRCATSPARSSPKPSARPARRRGAAAPAALGSRPGATSATARRRLRHHRPHLTIATRVPLPASVRARSRRRGAWRRRQPEAEPRAGGPAVGERQLDVGDAGALVDEARPHARRAPVLTTSSRAVAAAAVDEVLRASSLAAVTSLVWSTRRQPASTATVAHRLADAHDVGVGGDAARRRRPSSSDGHRRRGTAGRRRVEVACAQQRPCRARRRARSARRAATARARRA